MDKVVGIAGVVVVLVAVSFGASVLMALPVMWLWNAVVPDLFNLPVITFWQAFGLTLLCSFLFKSSSSSSSSK